MRKEGRKDGRISVDEQEIAKEGKKEKKIKKGNTLFKLKSTHSSACLHTFLSPSLVFVFVHALTNYISCVTPFTLISPLHALLPLSLTHPQDQPSSDQPSASLDPN